MSRVGSPTLGSITNTGGATADNQTSGAQKTQIVDAGGDTATVTGSRLDVNVDTSSLLTQSDFDSKTGSLTETAPATDTASSGLNGRLQRIAQRITSLITLLPTALGSGGGLKVDGSGTALPVDTEFPAADVLVDNFTNPTTTNIAALSYFWDGSNWDRARALASTTNTGGQGIQGNGIMGCLDDTSPTVPTENNFAPLRMYSDRSLFVANRSVTPTQTTVASSASSVSLLAANNARKGATITNDSSAILYLKLGATASTTSYTVTLNGAAAAPFSYYEVPFGYVGAIDGIWASATGNARITEIV